MYKTRAEKKKIRVRNRYSITTQYQIAIYSITILYQWYDCHSHPADVVA